MERIQVGDLHGMPVSAGFYEVSIGGTTASLGVVTPVGGLWWAAFRTAEATSPRYLGVAPTAADAINWFGEGASGA